MTPRRPRTPLQWVAAAAVVLVLAGGLFAWWWTSTADDRAWRASIEATYNQCLYQAAVAPNQAQSDALLARCDLERDTMLQRLGL